jgi:hypothetical protein
LGGVFFSPAVYSKVPKAPDNNLDSEGFGGDLKKRKETLLTSAKRPEALGSSGLKCIAHNGEFLVPI